MKRLGLAVLALALVLALSACGTSGAPASQGGSETSTAQPTKVDPYAAIPRDGVHEQAAYAAIPEALKYVEQTTTEQGRTFTDLNGGKATLVSYTLQATAGARICLFEVRGDGKAYELYRYPASPDPQKLFWQKASVAEGARLVEPLGTGEKAAAASVRKIVEQAAPGEDVTVMISGYNFYWIGSDGMPLNTPGGVPFSVSIDPSGAAGSWSM